MAEGTPGVSPVGGFFKAFKSLAISKKGRFKGIKYKQYICMLMNGKVCEEAHCSCSKCSL